MIIYSPSQFFILRLSMWQILPLWHVISILIGEKKWPIAIDKGFNLKIKYSIFICANKLTCKRNEFQEVSQYQNDFHRESNRKESMKILLSGKRLLRRHTEINELGNSMVN